MQYPILGHKNILRFFRDVRAQDMLSHAYCLGGREGLGKKRIALSTASNILMTDEGKIESHPDFLFVKQVRDQKTEKLKKDISISQIKDACHFLSRRPFLGSRSVLIIDDAEKMSVGASNALLKVLEEPPLYALIFLVTRDHSLLLQTVSSRCQHIFFQKTSKDILVDFLKEQSVDAGRAEDMATLSRGIPGNVIAWLENPEQFDEYKKEIERFSSLEKCSFHEKGEMVKEMFENKKDHITARNQLLELLDIWLCSLREQVVESSVAVVNSDMQREIGLYERIGEAKKMLRKNVHPKLLIEHILLEIS
ncbi:MAG: hypothetical protein ABII02_00135 [Candidatus Magasanikbacteria bacterium]